MTVIYICDICWRRSERKSDFYIVNYRDRTICHMCRDRYNKEVVVESIDEETIKEIDQMHVIDAIKERFEYAITYCIPVALTHEEAKLVLVEMGATIKDTRNY